MKFKDIVNTKSDPKNEAKRNEDLKRYEEQKKWVEEHQDELPLYYKGHTSFEDGELKFLDGEPRQRK